MVELEELVKLKEWNDLLHVLSQEQKASYRQILAAHTSVCCSPQHQPRMIQSLKDAGLDNPVAFEDKHMVTISLKAVHLGQANDSLPPLIVTSSPQPTVRDAQEQACQVTLAFLLSVGADQIRLHPSALAHGGRSQSLCCSRSTGPGDLERVDAAVAPDWAYSGHTRSLDWPDASQHSRGDGGLVESTAEV